MVTPYQKLLPDPKHPNDRARIYLAFKDNDGKLTTGQMVQYPPVGLGIAEYTGRISDLRKDGFEIKCESLNNYRLVNEPIPTLSDLRLLYSATVALGLEKLKERIVSKAQLLKHKELIKTTLF